MILHQFTLSYLAFEWRGGILSSPPHILSTNKKLTFSLTLARAPDVLTDRPPSVSAVLSHVPTPNQPFPPPRYRAPVHVPASAPATATSRSPTMDVTLSNCPPGSVIGPRAGQESVLEMCSRARPQSREVSSSMRLCSGGVGQGADGGGEEIRKATGRPESTMGFRSCGGCNDGLNRIACETTEGLNLIRQGAR